MSTRKRSIYVGRLILALRPSYQIRWMDYIVVKLTSQREHSLPPVKSVNLGIGTLGGIRVMHKNYYQGCYSQKKDAEEWTESEFQHKKTYLVVHRIRFTVHTRIDRIQYGKAIVTRSGECMLIVQNFSDTNVPISRDTWAPREAEASPADAGQERAPASSEPYRPPQSYSSRSPPRGPYEDRARAPPSDGGRRDEPSRDYGGGGGGGFQRSHR